MRCLCYSENFEDTNSVRTHYIQEHKVDENNHFLLKFFTRDRAFVPKSVSDINISARLERKKKNIIFFCITRAGGCMWKTSS